MTRGYEILRSKRIVVGIMGIMLLVVVLFSTFYIAHEAAHECTGDDCPICVCIAQCENILRQVGGGMVSRIAIALPAIFLFPLVCLYLFFTTQETLVSRKVRLNN